MASNLGGSLPGILPKQTMNNKKDSNQTMIRKILRDSWNNKQAQASINGYSRVTTPFRAVNNLGDYLGREDYVCGGSNQVNATYPGWKSRIGSIISQCDKTGVAASVTNNRYVADSSSYTTYRKQDAVAKNYNDIAFVGDKSNGSYVALMAVRRF